MKNSTITVSSKHTGYRIDKFIATSLFISRVSVKRSIESGYVSRNGSIVTSVSCKLTEGDTIIISDLDEEICQEDRDPKIVPEDICFSILYEDCYLMVVDKPAGLLVHPVEGVSRGTLINGLIHYLGNNISSIGEVFRPGLVHRLDKDTSGLMIIAKNNEVHRILVDMIAERVVKRKYLALLSGCPDVLQGTINVNIIKQRRTRGLKMGIAGKVNQKGCTAVTHYRVLRSFAGGAASLVECSLETGRTHQIRVHMEHLGCPVLGDKRYGFTNIKLDNREGNLDFIKDKINDLQGQVLHSYKLEFMHPIFGYNMKFCRGSVDIGNFIASLEKVEDILYGSDEELYKYSVEDLDGEYEEREDLDDECEEREELGGGYEEGEEVYDEYV